ncbi:uncharacterized protein BX664DRAFT_168841 [Halteromyces radiatus]|uniref:uncharacterized protein n=1 Tax=Halteromyces radiatus TaxID=101107 RepID=UPI002220C842|nr:uncharacterized protein BX664DRAFT_168841 [Halteromyces radiatus]KAI8084582.1 hypothetical protein BX664DRAFT_168841 [Halteromyces radiatus]
MNIQEDQLGSYVVGSIDRMQGWIKRIVQDQQYGFAAGFDWKRRDSIVQTSFFFLVGFSFRLILIATILLSPFILLVDNYSLIKLRSCCPTAVIIVLVSFIMISTFLIVIKPSPSSNIYYDGHLAKHVRPIFFL